MSSLEEKLPDGWVETTLGEQELDVLNGYAFKSKDFVSRKIDNKYLPVLKIKNVANGDANHNDVVFHLINDKIEKYRIQENDILIALTGNHPFAKTQVVGGISRYKMKLDSLLNQRVAKLKAGNNELLNNDFIYNFFKWNETQFYIGNQSSGSASQANISKNDILNIPLNLPPIQEQQAIANVLTAFDDKIENLRAQNQTLEQTAQTIFKEWFGKYQIDDELPDGWRVGTIGDLTEIKRGGSPRPIKNYISDSGYRWLKISDATATDSPYIFEIKEHIRVEGLKKTTLKKAGDLVLSNSATPGMPKFLAVDTCVHDGWMHFPSSIVSNEYLYLLFLYIRPTLVQQGSGSVFVNLKTDILRFYETVIPSNKALTDFDKLIKPIFDKILSNSKQIQTLTKTRDALLPKLMRGEIKVNGFKK